MIFGNMGEMMKMAKEMQGNLKRIKEELSLAVFEESSQGITVKVSGEMDVKEILISPQAVDPQRVGELERKIKDTANRALKKAKDEAARKLKGATGGLSLPGMF